MKLKISVTLGLALAVATPLFFNTTPVQAEPATPQQVPPAESMKTFVPPPAAAIGAFALQFAMRVAAAEQAAKGASTTPVLDGKTATKAFD